MKKKLKIAWAEILANRGSGLAYVMMAMTLLSLLATTLLNMTYMGYKIKAEDRQQKTDFYTVSTAMDEIRAGLQDTASDAAATAYKNYLMTYNISHTDQENEEFFQNYFIRAVEDSVCDIFMSEIYDVDKLNDMIKTNTGIEFEGNWTSRRIKKTATEIILNDVSLKYTNSAGNEITLNTDIVISAPSLASAEWNYNELVQYRNWSTN